MTSKRATARRPEQLLPMNAVDFHVLLVLVEGDSHGYGIVRAMRARTNGQIDILPGNFYTVLQRLVRDGLVEDAGLDAEGHTPGRPRRLYRITEFGRDVAAAEAERLRDLVAESTVRSLVDRSRAS